MQAAHLRAAAAVLGEAAAVPLLRSLVPSPGALGDQQKLGEEQAPALRVAAHLQPH